MLQSLAYSSTTVLGVENQVRNWVSRIKKNKFQVIATMFRLLGQICFSNRKYV